MFLGIAFGHIIAFVCLGTCHGIARIEALFRLAPLVLNQLHQRSVFSSQASNTAIERGQSAAVSSREAHQVSVRDLPVTCEQQLGSQSLAE